MRFVKEYFFRHKFGICFVITILILLFRDHDGEENITEKKTYLYGCLYGIEREVIEGAKDFVFPISTYVNQSSGMDCFVPIYGYVRRENPVKLESVRDEAKVDERDVEKYDEKYAEKYDEDEEKNINTIIEVSKETAEIKEEASEQYKEGTTEEIVIYEENTFVPHEKQMETDMEQLYNTEELIRNYYIVDNNTMIGKELLSVEELLGRNMSIEKKDEVQILIYHTHASENFVDSVEGDLNTGIVGVGQHLTEILQEKYGYGVLHHTMVYDTVRDNAYSTALPAIEDILAQNPSIKVVIDLHRDQMDEKTKLVMNLDGKPTARFMFFNGISRTKKTGDIDYLKNDNLQDNLAFSFQMQKTACEYYPGLTRKIYLKGYRYNMHLMPRYLLIELGAQNNTLEEAMNACGPLAHVLDLVLRGENS